MNMLRCTVHDPDLFSAEACGDEYYRKRLEKHIYELLAHHLWPIPRDLSAYGALIYKALESYPAHARQRMSAALEQALSERTVRITIPSSFQGAERWQSVGRGLAECMMLASVAKPDCTIIADANVARITGDTDRTGQIGCERLTDKVLPFAQYPDAPPKTQVDLARIKADGFRDYVLRPAMRWSPVIWLHDRYISESYARHKQEGREGRNWLKFRDTVRLVIDTWLAISKESPIADEYSLIQQNLKKKGQEVPRPGVHVITAKPDLKQTQWNGNSRSFAESLHSEIAAGRDSLSIHLVDEGDCLMALEQELGRGGRHRDHRMRHPRFLKSSFFTLTFEPGLDVVRAENEHIAQGTFVTLADEPARLVAKVMRLAANNCRVRWPDTSSGPSTMPSERKALGNPFENLAQIVASST